MSKDYFNHRNELPANIENILYEFGSVEEYNEAMELQSQLELQGWTFEMGLDCEPYDLHKMPEKVSKLDQAMQLLRDARDEDPSNDHVKYNKYDLLLDELEELKPDPEGKITKKCAECGGDKVYNTSRSYWNEANQEWTFDCHLTDDTYCDDCESMVQINDVKL